VDVSCITKNADPSSCRKNRIMLNFMHANATYIPTYIHAYITQHTPYQGFSVTGYIRAGTGVKQTEKTVSLQMAYTSLMICPWPMCLTHPVNFPCGRKPEYPEKTHDFRQSVDFYSFHMRTGFESRWEILSTRAFCRKTLCRKTFTFTVFGEIAFINNVEWCYSLYREISVNLMSKTWKNTKWNYTSLSKFLSSKSRIILITEILTV
jgi:hypothetical protein